VAGGGGGAHQPAFAAEDGDNQVLGLLERLADDADGLA